MVKFLHIDKGNSSDNNTYDDDNDDEWCQREEEPEQGKLGPRTIEKKDDILNFGCQTGSKMSKIGSIWGAC
jgi:hypothetical protein